MQKKRKQSKTKKTPAEKPDSIQPKKRTKLTPEKVTLLVYNYLNSNCNKTQALEKTGYSRTYARSKGQLVFQMLRVKNELAKQIKPIQAQVQVNIMQIQSALIRIAEKCENTEEYPAAISAYNSILKTIGGFQADRIPDNNLLGKALDAKTAEAINAILNKHYNHKYLAIPVEVNNAVQGQNEAPGVQPAGNEAPQGYTEQGYTNSKDPECRDPQAASSCQACDTDSEPQSNNGRLCTEAAVKPPESNDKPDTTTEPQSDDGSAMYRMTDELVHQSKDIYTIANQPETNDKPTVKDEPFTASHPVSSTITAALQPEQGRQGENDNIPESEGLHPQATPASPLHSPSLTCDGFSEKVVVGNEER